MLSASPPKVGRYPILEIEFQVGFYGAPDVAGEAPNTLHLGVTVLAATPDEGRV